MNHQTLISDLKETCRMKLDKIGKFLSAVLERTDALLRETE